MKLDQKSKEDLIERNQGTPKDGSEVAKGVELA
jgi:hypothetical protein